MSSATEPNYDEIVSNYPEVTLYMNNIPQGFTSHTIYGHIVALEPSGVVVLISWGNGEYRLMRFMNHAIIGIEFNAEEYLGDYL